MQINMMNSFFWTTDENGNEAVPRIFLTTPDAKNFVNFNNGSDGMSDVESGKYYEKMGHSELFIK